MFHRGFFLVIAQSDGFARALLTPAQQFTVARRLGSYHDALHLAPALDLWSAIAIDVDDFPGQEVEVLASLREAHPHALLLALSSAPSSRLISALAPLRVELSSKPAVPEKLESCARRALTLAWLADDRVAAWVDELSAREGLTPRDVQLLVYALGGEPRRQVMRRLGITENTLKTQVRSLLRKFRASSMDDLARTVLTDALERPYAHDAVNRDQGAILARLATCRAATPARRLRSGVVPIPVARAPRASAGPSALEHAS